MNILVITVCVNYSDILEICVQKNIKSIDNWFIITSSQDIATQNLCQKYNLKCYVTDVFYENNCNFNKSAALNELINNLHSNKTLDNFDCILLLDADIILNDAIDTFISYVSTNNIDNAKELLYGCSRKIFNSQEDYMNNNGRLEHTDFIGYFQLFFISKIKNDLNSNKLIFHGNTNASRYDDIFRDKYWPRKTQRQYLKSVVYHLGPIATNWDGRTSKIWIN